MNKIKSNKISREMYYKNTMILKYTIEYPEIIYSNYNMCKRVFNNYNKNKALLFKIYCEKELYKMAVEQYEYSVANGFPIRPFEAVLNYTITLNHDCHLSLYFDQYIFSGGAHGNTLRDSQNWNLKKCKQISLNELFLKNPNYITNILTQINNIIAMQISNGTNQYFDNYCQLVIQYFNLNSFYLTPDNLVIFYQQYDIAPYSSGISEFYIPYNLVGAVLPECF